VSKTVAQPPAPEWLVDVLRDVRPLATVEEAAALLRLSTRAVRRLAHSGRLISARDGGGRSPARLLFPRAELGRYIESIASR